MLAPSQNNILFAILMFVIWGALIPFRTIANMLLVVLSVMAAFKLVIMVIRMLAYSWRVSIDGNRVSFLQGSYVTATCKMNPRDTTKISFVDSRWLPRHLQIVRTNGEIVETLYGVEKSDLNVVVERLQGMLDSPQNSE